MTAARGDDDAPSDLDVQKPLCTVHAEFASARNRFNSFQTFDNFLS